MTTQSDDSWVAQNRKEYEQDTFKLLNERFRWLNRRIDDQSEWQATLAKEFAQNAAEVVALSVEHARVSLVLWLGLIAIVALASARLWFGVAGVALILMWVWRRNLTAARALWRFDRFRTDCFRELLKVAEKGNFGDKMLEQDKEFVLKCRDGILYPAAVAANDRKTIGTDDLQRIDTLYREYCSGSRHVHSIDPETARELKTCELCMTVRRLREHIEGVLSKFEADLESARQGLIARIDGGSSGAIVAKDFLEQYKEWEALNGSEPAISSVLETLREKDNWTFDEADKVRELCVTEIRGFEFRKPALEMFGVLTKGMESAAKGYGVESEWQFYDKGKEWLWKGTGFDIRPSYEIKKIRSAFARKNPEATVRELVHPDGSPHYEIFKLRWLKNYGFDGQMLRRELKSAWNAVRKEERERKEQRLMFETAWAWLWQAEVANKRVANWDYGLNP